MKLVDDAKSAWRWLSIQFIGLAFLWESIPDDAREVIPEPWRHWITIALIVGAGLGRMVKQSWGEE